MRTTAVATRQAVKTNCHSCRGGMCPTKRSLRAPLQCVPVKIQEIKFKIQLQN